MNLALFDFDGTISTRDSYLLFTRFLNRKKFFWGCLFLSPRIMGYLAKVYPNDALKQDFLRFFYKRKTAAELNVYAATFCSSILPAIIRPQALQRILWHQSQGDITVVVSACPRLILEPWCLSVKSNIIATEIEFDAQSKATGKIVGKNCWGQEKVHRIVAQYELKLYAEVFAYGDSIGDIPMLQLAKKNRRFFKPFR
ncbi:MAG: HAD-IB family hydrolase [Pseudomonadota bacterium]